jgi:asparagine synthase (glutamine-hydrolysing)
MEKLFRNFTQEDFSVLSRLNGHFAGAFFHAKTRKLHLFRDHFGVEPLYYYHNKDTLIFCSSPLFLLKNDFVPRELNPEGLYTYFLFNYNPLENTIIRDLLKVEPSSVLSFDGNELTSRKYWRLSYLWNESRSEEETVEDLRRLLRSAVHSRLNGKAGRAGAFLSGGMDSSTVVGLSSEVIDSGLHTFSFRCRGESFDESHYAQIMSEAYRTNHHLVEFPPQKSLLIEKLAEQMPEPFSDIGIEVATFLLGTEAAETVDYILTGDGGDELFAGHPVYIADRVARIIDRVPAAVKVPIFWFFSQFSDSDKKKSFPVKAKRFAYSANFPPTLYSNRWRIYYTEQELMQGLEASAWDWIRNFDPLPAMAKIYEEADGPDFLSRSLYGDYYTVVKFYLMRMNQLRPFGIEPRFPMFDYRLVEYAATIPSRLKIRSSEDTKYILKKAMEGILPDEIVFRKDKLGHSVPMKNWIRYSDEVRAFLQDVLSEQNLKRRGLFRPAFVQTLFEQHLSKKFNHSHRLWALAVLELWLQKHFDA